MVFGFVFFDCNLILFVNWFILLAHFKMLRKECLRQMNIIKLKHRSLLTASFSKGKRISIDRNKVYLKKRSN